MIFYPLQVLPREPPGISPRFSLIAYYTSGLILQRASVHARERKEWAFLTTRSP